MADLHRIITPRALRNSEFNYPVHRIASPPEAIHHDQALRIFRTNRRNEMFHDPHVICLRNIRRLIQQIKT